MLQFINSIFKRKQEYPKSYQDYLKQSFLPQKATLIEDQIFCVLDCETTGLDKRDKIVSIGAVKVFNHRILLNDVLDIKLSTVEVNQSSEIHEELSIINTQTKEEVLNQILNFIGSSVLVGHNVSFDIGKINSEYEIKLKNKVLDTFHLMKRIDPVRMERNVAGHDAYHLDELCKEYGVEIENRHTALGDAYLTAQVFIAEMRALERRGIKKVREVLRSPSI